MDKTITDPTAYTLEAEAVSRRGVTHETNDDSCHVDMDRGVFIVADGMGGHRDGNLASQAVVAMIEATASAWPDTLDDKVECLCTALQTVNNRLFAEYLEQPHLDISGSTALCLLIDNGYACCLWAGDSRLYLLRDGHLFLISEDHADPDGALTRAVGSSDALDVDRRILEIRYGDAFVLCTDGLLKGINETELADIVAGGEVGLSDRLLAKAIAGRSRDDITLAVVWVKANG